MTTEWRRSDEFRLWEYFVDGVMVAWISRRPPYCDRGHWSMQTDLPGIDHADSFPRYFMRLSTAKQETEEWVRWRMEKRPATEGQSPEIFEIRPPGDSPTPAGHDAGLTSRKESGCADPAHTPLKGDSREGGGVENPSPISRTDGQG